MNWKLEFENWIQQINKNESPSDKVTAFWFGLFESENGFTLYFTGSFEFDANDDDWACNIDFEPTNKYLELPTEYVKNKTWQTILSDTIEILNMFLKSNDFQSSIFKDAIAIATGFDGGDLHRLH